MRKLRYRMMKLFVHITLLGSGGTRIRTQRVWLHSLIPDYHTSSRVGPIPGHLCVSCTNREALAPEKMSPAIWIHRDMGLALDNVLKGPSPWDRPVCAGRRFQSRSPTPALSEWLPNMLKAQWFLAISALTLVQATMIFCQDWCSGPWNAVPAYPCSLLSVLSMAAITSLLHSEPSNSFLFHSQQNTKSF